MKTCAHEMNMMAQDGARGWTKWEKISANKMKENVKTVNCQVKVAEAIAEYDRETKKRGGAECMLDAINIRYCIAKLTATTFERAHTHIALITLPLNMKSTISIQRQPWALAFHIIATNIIIHITDRRDQKILFMR